MARSPSFFIPISLLLLASLSASLPPPPPLDAAEQDALYRVLSAVNPSIPWRTLYPDDFCVSAPHGVVCDYFIDDRRPDVVPIPHITELSFGYVSDFSPNPPCSPNSTLDPLIFADFKFLRKLFFYKCFNQTPVVFANFSSSENLEELVFVENPALVGPLGGVIGNFTSLRRFVLTGSGVYGEIPSRIGDLSGLEEVTLSRNRLTGAMPARISELKKLKILDLSQNQLDGILPDSIGNLNQVLKLDLSYNGFSGRIPESLINLTSLIFLDLSFNKFGNHGIPLFIGEISSLREVYLNGNFLGGQIPEIWGKLGGISAIGFSSMGLTGKIPPSIGVYLKNLSYLRLDNNSLEGEVPRELGFLELANEINLENNNLSGRVPFSAKFTARVGRKLKLKGNSMLCINGGNGWICSKSNLVSAVLFKEGNSVSSASPFQGLCCCSSSLFGLVMLGFVLGLNWVV